MGVNTSNVHILTRWRRAFNFKSHARNIYRTGVGELSNRGGAGAEAHVGKVEARVLEHR